MVHHWILWVHKMSKIQLLNNYQWEFCARPNHIRVFLLREKGSTTLKIYLYWIFYHTKIETCFEMLIYSEQEKLGRNSNSLIFKIFLKLVSLSPNLFLLLNSKNRGPWFLLCMLIETLPSSNKNHNIACLQLSLQTITDKKIKEILH